MTDTKRKTLKEKVEAGQARNQDRGRTTIVDRAGEAAIEAKDKFTTFARKHPIATVAGGLAVGVLVASMFRGPRRAAVRGGSKAAGLAALGAELALAYAQQAMDAAGEAGKAGAKRLDGLGDTAKDVGRQAANRAGDAGESAAEFTREAGKRLSKAIRSRIN